MTSLIAGSQLFTLTMISWIANAAPVKVAETKIGEQEITTILMSDKLLGPFLLMNAVQFIMWLVKSIWNGEKKQLEEIKQSVAHIPNLLHKVEIMDQHLKNNVPTHDSVEVKIWRALKDLEK